MNLLLGILAGAVTAAVLVFLYVLISLLGRSRHEIGELQKGNAAYVEAAKKQADIIRKLAEENQLNRPYSIHISDEQVFHLAHMIITHMETLQAPKN